MGTGVSSGDSNNLWLAPKIELVYYDNGTGTAVQQISYKVCDPNTYSNHAGVSTPFTYAFTFKSDKVTKVDFTASYYYMKPWKPTVRYYWSDTGAEATDSATQNKIDETQSVTDAERNVASCPTSPDADKHSCLAKKMIYDMREGEAYNSALGQLAVPFQFNSNDYVNVNIKMDIVFLSEHGTITSGNDFT